MGFRCGLQLQARRRPFTFPFTDVAQLDHSKQVLVENPVPRLARRHRVPKLPEFLNRKLSIVTYEAVPRERRANRATGSPAQRNHLGIGWQPFHQAL